MTKQNALKLVNDKIDTLIIAGKDKKTNEEYSRLIAQHRILAQFNA